MNTKTKTNKLIFFSTLFIAIFLLVMNQGCKKDDTSRVPVACFATLADSVMFGTNVTFNGGCSTGATSYLWNFGDGNTSAAASTTHAYTTPGSYAVTLTVTNAKGSNTKTKTIIV